MKFNNTELLGWVNHRVLPMIAVLLLHFLLGVLYVVAFGLAGPDSGIPLFIMSVASALFAVLFVFDTIGDMWKLLNGDSTDEFKTTAFAGGGTMSKGGFTAGGVIFSILIIAAPVAHGILFL